MNKKEIEKIGDPEEYDWDAFFARISIVCPWSQMYWNRNQIEIVEWTGEIFELSNDCIARLYKCPTVRYGEIEELIEKMNRERPKEKWFSTMLTSDTGTSNNPIGSLIQQDRAFLIDTRNKYLHDKPRK